MSSENKICLIVGASHAGVNCAFALRKEGWEGEIHLFDGDPHLPYHRPPLSKSFMNDEGQEQLLKSPESYIQEKIELHLGIYVQSINEEARRLILDTGETRSYDVLVLATGARPLIPQIPGLKEIQKCFYLRSLSDTLDIKRVISEYNQTCVGIIGGGFIGLEIASSLRKLGANVTVIEKEDRVLARVTSIEISSYFEQMHKAKGVKLLTDQHVSSVRECNGKITVTCDSEAVEVDLLIVGVGVVVSTELAREAGLKISNGIEIDANCRSSNEGIYAIGDCTYHYNSHFNRYLRLESIQNANDQAKVAAKNICGKEVVYDAIPWFWSDQFDIKFQMVGLCDRSDTALVRKELDSESFSVWYFKGEELQSVHALDNPRAYMLGTKIIKEGKTVDKKRLQNPHIELRPSNF